MNRQENMTNTKHKKAKMFHKRSTALEWSVKYFYWKALTSYMAPTQPLILMRTRTHLGKKQNTRKHNTHDSQDVGPFPAGNHKAERNRHESSTHTKMKHNLQKRIIEEAPPLNSQWNIYWKAETRFTSRHIHVDVLFAWHTPKLSMNYLLIHRRFFNETTEFILNQVMW